ncbi:MAG: HD domain-containing protein [Bacteroidota bacterium]|nr:HD domain-containing protein [Bacteroidota bacterium]
MKKHLKHPVFRIIAQAAENTQTEAYVIGGFVRDIFLERKSKDADIVAIGSGIELARETACLAKVSEPRVFKNFGTAMLQIDNWEIEFVGARKESYRKDSRKPIVENGSLEDDQNRRDFTINAMALSLNKENYGTLLDPFQGMQDLESRIIRTPLEPILTFSDDPLRMMRAIRFATQLHFKIHPETFEAIRKSADRIEIVSKERILDELNKIILSDKPSTGFKLLHESGLMKIIFPEFEALRGAESVDGKGHKDNFYHTLEVLDKLSDKTDNLWLRWAAILHDIAKPATKRFEPGTGWTFHSHEFVGAKMVPRIFRRMKLPVNEKMRFVQKLVQLHLRPIALTEENVSDSAIRRLLFEAGDDIDDLMMLCEADITSKNQHKVKRYLRNFRMVRRKLQEVEAKDRIRNWEPPISGDIIIKTFKIEPSREVGRIKTAIREAILDGVVEHDFKKAFLHMLEIGKENGLKTVKKLDDFQVEMQQWYSSKDLKDKEMPLGNRKKEKE